MSIIQAELEKVRDVFAIFHDGGITSWRGDKTLLRLKIECLYLAELVNEDYDHFHIELIDVERIILEPWMNPVTLPQEYFVEIQQIFHAELEVLSSEIEGELVKVHCNQRDNSFSYSGGILYLKCRDIKILDQGGRDMTQEELDTLCKKYWNKFNDHGNSR